MTESTCITRLNTVQINSFIASSPASRVVCGPNHGPRVDVEQLAARYISLQNVISVCNSLNLCLDCMGVFRGCSTGSCNLCLGQWQSLHGCAVSQQYVSASCWSMKKPVIKRLVLRQFPSAHRKILLPALSTFHPSRRALRFWCIRAMRLRAVPCGPCCGRPALAAFSCRRLESCPQPASFQPLHAHRRGSSRETLQSLDKTSKYNINMYKYTHIQTYTYTYAHSYLAIFLSINQQYMHIRAYTCRYRHIHTNMRTSLYLFECIKPVLVFRKTVLHRSGLVVLCKLRSQTWALGKP